MLLSFFSALYEVFIGQNPDYPEYRETIFSAVGLLTILLGLALAVIFYIVLGRWRPIWDKPAHWGITLALAGILGFVLAYTQAAGAVGATDSYTLRFALFNALFAIIYFTIFSFLLKRFSIFSRHTPLKT